MPARAPARTLALGAGGIAEIPLDIPPPLFYPKHLGNLSRAFHVSVQVSACTHNLLRALEHVSEARLLPRAHPREGRAVGQAAGEVRYRERKVRAAVRGCGGCVDVLAAHRHRGAGCSTVPCGAHDTVCGRSRPPCALSARASPVRTKSSGRVHCPRSSPPMTSRFSRCATHPHPHHTHSHTCIPPGLRDVHHPRRRQLHCCVRVRPRHRTARP